MKEESIKGITLVALVVTIRKLDSKKNTSLSGR